jgi:Xaa-Pro dipeptidase
MTGAPMTARHLEALQQAMRDRGLDALLLGGEAAGQFAAGHGRIGVHMPGWPIPVAAVSRSGSPHIVTADPEGALGLPADHVHGMMWNPETLISELPRWLGSDPDLRIGVDAMSPGGRALIEAALPGCTLVDATPVLADVMLTKSPEEVAAIEELCRLVTTAAEAGLRDGRAALVRALHGAFPIAYPQLGATSVRLAVRRGGVIAEARLGPGDPRRGEAAVDLLRPGANVAAIAAALPPGVEVVGTGWSYEPPLLRDGSAFPADLDLRRGAVLGVHWDACGVTAVVEADGPRLLSLAPTEVAR